MNAAVMANGTIQLSVIVPTCRRNQELAECLERLAPGRQARMALVSRGAAEPPALERASYDVIVTDDGRGSTAEAMVRERFPWARWLQGPRRGPAANRNHGARHARGRWLAFIDDDCLPGSNWLDAFASGIPAAGSSPQVLEGRTQAMGERPHPLAQCPVNETGGCLWSCNFAIERGVFRDLGGFEEQFPYAAVEDIEFQIRLKKSGVTQQFLAGALVHHPWKQVRFLDVRRKQVVSQLLLRKLHPEQRRWISLGMHARRVARFYAKELPDGIRRFGWRQLSCLPVQVCDHAQTAAIFVLHALRGARSRS